MNNLTTKICVVTGTRAEYGLLRSLIQGIANSDILSLNLVVTGMHLSPEFGLTVEEIEHDGIHIDRKLEMLLSSDTPVAITKSMGLAMIGFADAFAELEPDVLLLLGDRYEILAAATAALIARIPVAHIHGGELTEGAFDDAIRHSITKMATLHFVATENYRNRVIQLGEQPCNVHNVGGLGVDNIKNITFISQNNLEESLGFKFLERNLLITFHPVTLGNISSSTQLDELLKVLSDLSDVGLIFTMPNADTDSRILSNRISRICDNHSNASSYTSLGYHRYLSCMNYVDGVVGNSSSGLLEAPSFGIGTVNIGDRQKGRIKSTSIIDCEPSASSISLALQKLFSVEFKSQLYNVVNPYGSGGASKQIIRFLENNIGDISIHKQFYDLN